MSNETYGIVKHYLNNGHDAVYHITTNEYDYTVVIATAMSYDVAVNIVRALTEFNEKHKNDPL